MSSFKVANPNIKRNPEDTDAIPLEEQPGTGTPQQCFSNGSLVSFLFAL